MCDGKCHSKVEIILKKVLAVLLSIVMCASLAVTGFAYWRDCDTFDVYVPEYFEGSEYDYYVESTYEDYEDDYYAYIFDYYDENGSSVYLTVQEYFGRFDYIDWYADSQAEYYAVIDEMSYEFENLYDISGCPAVVLEDYDDGESMGLTVAVATDDFLYIVEVSCDDPSISDIYYEVYDNIWGMGFYTECSYFEEYYEEDYDEGSATASSGGSSSASSSGAGASSSGGSNTVIVNNNINTPATSRPVAEKPTTEKASVPNQQEKLEKAQTTDPSQVTTTTANVTANASVQATESTTAANAENNEGGSNTGLIVAIIVAAVIIGGALIAVCVVMTKKKK